MTDSAAFATPAGDDEELGDLLLEVLPGDGSPSATSRHGTRLGRLWQTLVLSRWNPLLAWLPIEEVIRARQQGYHESLGQADQQGELEPFVSYLLTAIEDALQEAIRTQGISAMAGSEMSSEIGSEMGAEKPSQREVELLEQLGISQRAIEKHLAALQRQGRLRRLGSPRSGSWQVLPPGPGA